MTVAGAASWEILVLGPLIVRRKGAVFPPLTAALAEALTILAVSTTPLTLLQLKDAHNARPSTGSTEKYLSRLRTERQLPVISSGPKGKTEYQLDPAECHVDARCFVAGVRDGQPVGDLMSLWHGSVDARVLESRAWRPVAEARYQLVQRVAGLPESEQEALASQLSRFTSLFPWDRSLDPLRPHGPGSLPRLLVVEDDQAMLTEICEHLKGRYRVTPVSDIKKWRELRDDHARLRQIDGALVDLHLTSTLDDKRGMEVVTYLRDNTDTLAALVTANSTERDEYGSQQLMTELRLVNIVHKSDRNDWWNALDRAVGLLVGHSVEQQKHRLTVRLETARRKLMRETEGAAPGTVPAERRRACQKEYGDAWLKIQTQDIDVAESAVNAFCGRWR